jgi:hypothetical protein
MMIVFLSGSRAIKRLPAAVIARLDAMIANGLDLVIGDAAGADAAMQTHLAERGYRQVTVYCAGRRCRHNLSGWPVEIVEAAPRSTGRTFYTAKDRAMAARADIGFVVWDGASQGSLANLQTLADAGKTSVVWHHPGSQFVTVRTESDLDALRRAGAPASAADPAPLLF